MDLKPVTRIFERTGDSRDNRTEPRLLHEFECHLPVLPEGSLIHIGSASYRIAACTVLVDPEREESVLLYDAEDPEARYPR